MGHLNIHCRYFKLRYNLVMVNATTLNGSHLPKRRS